jgi:hypothetical protein
VIKYAANKKSMKTAIGAIEMINTSSPCFDQNSRNLIMSAATDEYCCSFRPAYVSHFSKRIATICAMISFIRSSTAIGPELCKTKRGGLDITNLLLFNPDLMGIFDDGYQQAMRAADRLRRNSYSAAIASSFESK